MTAHEMVETIVLGALSGRPSGTLGSAERIPDFITGFRVRLSSGLTCDAICTAFGWEVLHKDMTGCDRDLLEAARLAMEP